MAVAEFARIPGFVTRNSGEFRYGNPNIALGWPVAVAAALAPKLRELVFEHGPAVIMKAAEGTSTEAANGPEIDGRNQHQA